MASPFLASEHSSHPRVSSTLLTVLLGGICLCCQRALGTRTHPSCVIYPECQSVPDTSQVPGKDFGNEGRNESRATAGNGEDLLVLKSLGSKSRDHCWPEV